MAGPPVTRHIRAVFEGALDCLSLPDLLTLVDEFVVSVSSSEESPDALAALEEQLATIHHDVVAHSSLPQTEAFLAILYHLNPILPPTSVISWFDVVLRPALKEPKLPNMAVNYAKELIISALQKDSAEYVEKVEGFRRRLFDLYLLDAYNEGSGEDVLEWAELDEEQREKRMRWKANLEEILLKYGNERPSDLMTEINNHFETPSLRLQLIMLLNLYTSGPMFESSASVLAAHPLVTSLIYSVLLDNSSTLCTATLTVLVKLLPIFAVHSRETLRAMLPKLLAILGRILCWRVRHPVSPEEGFAEPEQFEDQPAPPQLSPRSDIQWQILEKTFKSAVPTVPSPRPYYTTLYYLYPSNVLRWLRGPAKYLSKNFPSPYTLDWFHVQPDEVIRRKGESVVREHICHPNLIWRDAAAEVSEPEFWARYSVARITTESCMLDIRNTALGIREAIASEAAVASQRPESTTPVVTAPAQERDSESTDDEPDHIRIQESIPHTVSLTDMISTSLVLKSDVQLDVLKPASQWPRSLFSSRVPSPSRRSIALPQEQTTPQPPPQSHDGDIPPHVAQTIASLQREVLLLRNELNFEQWLSRENAKHIGRLYQDRILIKTAEAERQGLYNKLRRYRAQVIDLEGELREFKVQASSAKNKYADWNTELQKKLREFREEKKAWITEAAKLRSAEKEVQALFKAQAQLLADAVEQLQELKIQKKENQHKIDRLKDYEEQIEQHVKMQRLWDEDFARFNERATEIEYLKSQFKQLHIRLEASENAQIQKEEISRAQRRTIQTLEARIAHYTRRHSIIRPQLPTHADVLNAEKASLVQDNEKLRSSNEALMDELEEHRAMLEVLRAQVEGRKGLIH